MSTFAQKRISTDIVIVGAGGAGLSAAVAALEGGANVVLLEKAPVLGGNTRWVEGLSAIDSQMMREDNVLLTADMAYHLIMDYGHWKNNAALVRRFTLESGKIIEWLQQRGTKFERVATAIPGNPYRVWHLFEKHLGLAMTDPFGKIIADYQKKGQALALTSTPGIDLIMKDDKVAGITAKNLETGEIITIDCKAVIEASGGSFTTRSGWPSTPTRRYIASSD